MFISLPAQFAARHRHVNPVHQLQSRSARDIYRRDQPPPPTPPLNAPILPLIQQPTPYPQQPPPPNVLTILQRTPPVNIPGLERPSQIKPNTRSKHESFFYADTAVRGLWKEFTSANVVSTFWHLLAATQYTCLNPITSQNSPVAQVYDGNGVTYRLSTISGSTLGVIGDSQLLSRHPLPLCASSRATSSQLCSLRATEMPLAEGRCKTNSRAFQTVGARLQSQHRGL